MRRLRRRDLTKGHRMTIGAEWEPDPIYDIGDDEPPAPVIDPASEVKALTEANSHLRHIARLRRQLATLDAVYRAELDRLEDRHEHRRGIILRQIAWHEAPCIGLHAALLASDPRRKTVELPHGVLRSRTPSKPTYVMRDPDAFVAWAEDHAAELVRTKKVPAFDAIKKADHLAVMFPADDDAPGLVVFTETGEHVPGIEAMRPATAYTVATEDES